MEVVKFKILEIARQRSKYDGDWWAIQIADLWYQPPGKILSGSGKSIESALRDAADQCKSG